MKQLFCFDFDNTIVKGHFHSQLAHQWIEPFTNDNTLIINGTIQGGNQNERYNKKLVKEHASELLKNLELGIQDPEELKSLFNNILSSGHKIAITSFTKYPDVIAVMLNNLTLTQEQIKDINIIGGFPKDGARDHNCKTEHIESAMYLAGIHNKHNVVLIDDSKNNIENAKQQGIQTVHVAKGRADWSVVHGMVRVHVSEKTTEVSNNISAPLDKLHNLSATDQKLINELKNKLESNVELRQKDSVKNPPKSHRYALVPEEYKKHDASPLIPPKSDEVRKKYNLSPQDLKKGASSNEALHNKLQQELKQKISLKKNQSSLGR